MFPRKNGRRGELMALCAAMLLPSLGTSIANVALPTLASAFAAPMHEVQWVVLAYLLATTVFIVGAGRLGDRLGHRRVLLAGMALFAVASAVCVVAPSLWVFVIARAAQGLGAAIMMAQSLALAARIGSPARTGSIVGLLGSVSAVGTALGPSLGGALIAALGWPSLFAALAVTAAVAFFAGAQRLPVDRPATGEAAGLDPAGTLLLALALAGYALAMTLGGTLSGPAVATLAGLSVAAFSAFAFAEARVAHPLIRVEMLRDRVLSVGLLSMGIVSTVVMATLVVGPFYLAQVLGLEPVGTGLVMSVGPAIAALAGVPAGRLADRAGTFPIAMVGLAGVTMGSVLMVILPGALGVAGYIMALAVITSGYALFQAANATAVMARAGNDGRGLISALLGLSRNLGLITGASAMGALFAIGMGGVFHLLQGGESGLQLTFAVAAGLAGVALLATWWGHVRDRSTKPDTRKPSLKEK